MNKLKIITLIFLCSQNLLGDGLVDTFKKTTGVKIGSGSEKLFVDIVQEKRNILEKVQAEHQERLNTRPAMLKKENEEVEEIQNIIDGIERYYEHIHYGQPDSFTTKELALYKELLQIIQDKQRVNEDVLSNSEALINTLKRFVNDPEFSSFRKERKIEEHLFYSFEDLHTLHDMIVNQERLVAQLAEQEKNTLAEQDNRKRMAKASEDDHNKQVEELQNLLDSEATTSKKHREEKDLMAIEELLYRNKKILFDLRLQESKISLDLTQITLFIERSHLDLLRQHLRLIKLSIRVNENDVTQAKEQIKSKKNEYLSKREYYQRNRDALTAEQKRKERLRDLFSKEHDIPLGRDIDEWNREPKRTSSSYLSIAALGVLNSEVQWLQKERDLIETERSLEDEKFNYLTVLGITKELYYKISNRKFITSEEITQEIKQAESLKAEAQSRLSIMRERISSTADILNHQKTVLDNLKAWYSRTEKNKETVFKGKSQDYARMLELIKSSEENIKKRIDVLGKLTGIYSAIISEINATIRILSFIIGELQTTTIWYRPEYAISMQGIKNILPDLFVFFGDIRSYIVRIDFQNLLTKASELAQWPLLILLFLLKITLLLIIIFGFKAAIPKMRNIILEYETNRTGIKTGIAAMIRAFLVFIDEHFRSIAIWIITLFIALFTLVDPYIYTLFYLLSIPYLLYVVNQFIQLILHLNMHHEEEIISASFHTRVVTIIGTVLYATIFIFCFRQAFIHISYYQTELPTILLAINFIILQLALIFLLSKEQILSVMPNHNEVWLWVREQVDTYFYLILLFIVAIIVMSNPYVGFGRLVLYILSSLIYTLLLFKALLSIHGWVKQAASYTFFIADEEVARERFDHARTWFGLFIIASFVVLTFLGVIIVGKIWGWQITFKEVLAWISKPLLLENTTYPITILSILQIILFILAGFVAAYAINHFVLDRIFDLLLVDPGVQYTTIRFIQYSVVIIFVFFGFKNVGLGDLIGYALGALALGIGWYVREPIGDLVAYFIILVQRPLKIGDFIQIDQEVFGVVRKITPRAVVIRRRNSTTVVVPNSQIMNKAIVNWNYVRNFIAFNDILIVVSYKEDPSKVRDLLMQAVSSHPNVLRNPKPIVRLEDFGEYGYIYMVRGFISSAYTLDMWDIASDVRLAMAKLLQENNIEIAELARIMREGMNRLNQLSPQQRENMERKVRE